jgi:anaphase-promoting complex subunit 3
MRINKLSEAEQALVADLPNKGAPTKAALDQVTNGAHGLFLLGQISERLGKKNQAIECYEKAFQKNQTLFVAFEKVNQLSSSRETIANSLAVLKAKPTNTTPIKMSHVIIKNFVISAGRDKENAAAAEAQPKRLIGSEPSFALSFQQKGLGSSKHITKPIGISNELVQSVSSSLKKASPRSKKRSTEYVSRLGGAGSESNSLVSSLALSQIHCGNQVGGAGNPTQFPDGFHMRDHLAMIGVPYSNLLNQRITEALEDFMSLKKPLDFDPWVLANIGRCHTEISNHVDAERYFKICFEREPQRTENADYYSSCLWQLKRQVELSKLAFSMIENHFFASETWVAHANCYSLIQDHDSAITFLLRATQLDPLNSYANCLIGHEYVSKENFEKAREFYQKAIKLDSKNVRALFGLGSLELNAGKQQEAIDNFMNAIKINGQCSTFFTQLGIAYKHKRQFEDALTYFNKAEQINETEKINRFNKADVLFKLGRYKEAIVECRRVLNEAKESAVYCLLGQIYQKLGDMEEAHANFELAIKMDKKEASRIKQFISTLELKN